LSARNLLAFATKFYTDLSGKLKTGPRGQHQKNFRQNDLKSFGRKIILPKDFENFVLCLVL
jgi:hypothetical protein